ncbi:hypothetical protein Trco_003328 [Trichoderma cornu-damae]|uniref:Fucose-specific lectin n=1 Tax=Trichoderma cornu-damae TaxID=654480 RepID=A0A9P8QKE7_9HYPO|nr:hypothetical protein Trco_003328 [Trichoderma cornu-damae]
MLAKSIAVLALGNLINTASGASLYAFYTGSQKGVQVGMQDPKSGDIWVSNCNSNINGAPLLPTDSPLVLPLEHKPKPGSSLAATGWWDSQKVIASIFWHSQDNKLVNGFYQCNPESGILIKKGEYIISDTANIKSIHANTGLSVELLGSTAGYRLYYHDEDSRVNQLSYTTSTDWTYAGIVSQDPVFGYALGSAHSATTNISVVFPRSAKDMEVSRFNKDNTWHIATFPETIQGIPTNNTLPSKISIDPNVAANFTLPAWNGKPGAIGVAIDSAYTRTVFYVGNDKKLYEAANINYHWTMLPNQSISSWPEADEPNAELAVTYSFDSNEAWVYYMSNGTLLQAYRGTDGNWKGATMLATSAGTPGGSDAGAGAGSADGTNGTPSAALSTGAKAGIGIGVSVGAIGVGLLGLFLFLRRRRQRAAANVADKDQPINLGETRSPSEQASNPLKKGTPDINMPSPPVEMEQPPMIYELPQTNYNYELAADSVERR